VFRRNFAPEIIPHSYLTIELADPNREQFFRGAPGSCPAQSFDSISSMRAAIFPSVILCLLAAPRMATACSCVVTRSVCQEAASSNLVFIGTVESAQGTKAHFKIQNLFLQKDDDDKPAAKPDYVDVSSGSGDCGIVFQKGESYLVYANDDEQTGRMQTNLCYRTTRLSEAGEDLPYLFFVQNGGLNSLRLEGFVTSEISQLLPDPLHYSPKIKSPVADVMVEVKSSRIVRYMQSDPFGRFVFDGLPEGDYQVTVFSAAYPERMEKLSGPKPVHLSKNQCGLTTLFVINPGLSNPMIR